MIEFTCSLLHAINLINVGFHSSAQNTDAFKMKMINGDPKKPLNYKGMHKSVNQDDSPRDRPGVRFFVLAIRPD